MKRSKSRVIFSGMLYGISGWATFAIVEFFFSVLLSGIIWKFDPEYFYLKETWVFSIIAYFIYLITGFISGGLIGAAIYVLKLKYSDDSKSIFTIAIPISIILISSISHLSHRSLTELADWMWVIFYVFLISFFLLTSFSKLAKNKLYLIRNIWFLSAMLVGLPWLSNFLMANESYGFILKIISLVVFSAIITSIFLFLEKKVFVRLKPNISDQQTRISIRYPAVLTLIFFLMLLTTPLIKKNSIVFNSSPNALKLNDGKPNIILITLDTVRRDHLSLYGYQRATTPFLKSFSKDALVFNNAFAAGDFTLSSHASIFTGMYASRHGAHYAPPDFWEGRPLRKEFNTLAELLYGGGYYTAGVIGNPGFLGPKFGLSQGFQYYDQQMAFHFFNEIPFFYLRKSLRDFLTIFADPSIYDKTTRTAGEINERAFKVLNVIEEKQQAFFLFINYFDAHWPYIPPAPFDTLYPGKDRSFDSEKYFAMAEKVNKSQGDVTQSDKAHMISQYDGEITYLDYKLKELFEYLKRLDLYDNSLIIITSDHGEAFGEKQIVGHGLSVYQDEIYVPLIIKFPFTNEHRVYNWDVSLIDLMPTILDVLGYDIPKAVQGISFLTSETNFPRAVICESFPRGISVRFRRIERAIISENHKLIKSTNGKHELYDLTEDPNETRNLYDLSLSKETDSLEVYLKRWTLTNTYLSGKKEDSEIDENSREILKSLGYIK